MKKLIVCLLLLATILSAASCTKRTAMNSVEKTFSTEDFSITLTDSFKQVQTNEYAAQYEASDVEIIFVKEAFENLTEEQQSLTLEQYAKLVHSNNSKKNELSPYPLQEEGMYSMNYTSTEKDTTYKALCTMFVSGSAFWTVTFTCEQEKYAEYDPIFKQWAKSILFVENPLDFTQDELVITLTENFKLAEKPEENKLAATISKDDSIFVNITKAAKSDSKATSLADYAAELLNSYKMSIIISGGKESDIGAIETKEDFTTFTYEKKRNILSENGVSTKPVVFTRIVVFYESNDNYWAVEFSCKKTEYEKYESLLMDWAKTVTFAY